MSTKTYRPGAYRTLFMREPKPLRISAAPYRDRVVHHALVNVLEPIFERTFIHDSYACRNKAPTPPVLRPCLRGRAIAWPWDLPLVGAIYHNDSMNRNHVPAPPLPTAPAVWGTAVLGAKACRYRQR